MTKEKIPDMGQINVIFYEECQFICTLLSVSDNSLAVKIRLVIDGFSSIFPIVKKQTNRLIIIPYLGPLDILHIFSEKDRTMDKTTRKAMVT